ncbi:DUF1559 domain-containing protein [uncultured Gimesia sp.]|uniref:DUF1559 family PulG-like putative transporter n=1 Tax=uncultured Gimesia sp. TaxID=1678688 RepID=UPI0026206D37|nr:DUF1559 domain-containing protein [uncultured Gimesia sp.]
MAKQRWINVGVCLGICLLLVALILPAIQQAREAARRATSKNTLRHIGLALHNYHETHLCYPPGSVIREDGQAMHGWLTMLLPYLSQNSYFNRIDFNKSWDNPVNSYVLSKSYPMYLMPGIEDDFTSTGFSLIHNLGNPNLLYRNSNVTFEQMKNGTAHTWAIGEVAGNYQPWGYPYNWRPLGTKLCNGPQSYGRPAWNGGHFVFADGRVSFLSNETAPEILLQLATAPPIATKEQTTKPATTFQTGTFRWERIELLSNPQGENYYFANVLQDAEERPLVMKLYFYANLTEEERDQEKLVIPVSYFFLQIDSTTDVATALKATSLSKATTPAQFQANVKTLQQMQKRLQK